MSYLVENDFLPKLNIKHIKRNLHNEVQNFPDFDEVELVGDGFSSTVVLIDSKTVRKRLDPTCDRRLCYALKYPEAGELEDSLPKVQRVFQTKDLPQHF